MDTQAIERFLRQTRRRGNTTALAEAAKASGGTIVVHDHGYATDVSREHGVIAVGFRTAEWDGTGGPVFADLSLVCGLANDVRDLSGMVGHLKEEVRVRESQTLQAQRHRQDELNRAGWEITRLGNSARDLRERFAARFWDHGQFDCSDFLNPFGL